MYFYLHIGPQTADGAYPLEAVTPAGTVTERLSLPDKLVARAAGLLRPDVELSANDESALGIFLARQIFTPPVRDLLARSVALARDADAPLHLALHIDTPAIAALPWEWLTIAGKSRWSPALLEDYGLLRVSGPADGRQRTATDVRRPPTGGRQPATAGQGPLRILLAAPDEHDETLAELAAALDEQVQAGLLKLSVSTAATAGNLKQDLRRHQPQVLHLIAPVSCDHRGRAGVTFSSPHGGRGELLDAAALRDLIGGRRDAALALVVLDGNWSRAGLLIGAGPRLALDLAAPGPGSASCISFHSPLYPAESALFARHLYGALAANEIPTEAVARARRALAEGGAEAVWGMPVLAQHDLHAPLWNSGPSGERAARKPLIQPRRSRMLHPMVVPAITASAGLLMAFSVFGWQHDEGQAATAGPAAAPTRAAVFTIALPTPTFTEPAATPALAVPSPAATGAPATARLSPGALPAPGHMQGVVRWTTYLVQPGDTIPAIALRMGSDPQALAALNRVGVDDRLAPERALVVPVYRPGLPGTGGIDVHIGRQDRPEVALTFDTEIDDVMLYQILDVLRRYDVKSTFFVTGRWTQAYPDAARALVAEGHELGNHSLSHPAFTTIGADGVVSELQATEDIVQQTAGVTTRPFFRFPYGDKNASVLNIVAEQGYISYHWTADDSALPYWLDQVAAGQVSPNGAIILMHQRPSTIAGLPGWIERLQSMGVQPVPLSRVLR